MSDVGNPNDPTIGFGQVNYDYHIGTYEVTNAQYATFLNSVAATDTHNLYNMSMAGSFGGIVRSGSIGSYNYSTIVGRENNPVNYVSFWDAARFTNWLTTGNTETGVYMLTADGIANNTITRDATAWANGGVAVASENEWYKAAYYSGLPTGADGDGYWLCPTQSNTITTADANYANSVGNVIAVGSYTLSASHYGTFDQGGNVWEWNDEIINSTDRLLRGGYFGSNSGSLESSFRTFTNTTFEFATLGFRVSSLEPITETSEVVPVFGLPWLVLLIGSLLGLGYRKIRQS